MKIVTYLYYQLIQHLTAVIFGLDTSYQNKHLINRESGKNPIFVDPMMLHFTKDKGAFG